ncbi:hypothetical protein MCNS_35120 [Mycobacterium conspicuum]|jgi:hypothetical protein|nr:hypothetical protein AWC00_00665 [Mycobacterium conspicuum]BBZ40449.1 hypothetical protein MCNS_35120 [Mycobacterium conspicuum]CNG88097.1 Uncharacterised protein [Mycobacterium tuberculosis]
MLINGEIAILAGYIAICATDVNGDNPDAADSTADNAADGFDTAELTTEATFVNVEVTDEPTDEPNDDNAAVACDSNDDTHPVNPAKLNGGTSNCANVDATDADVE